MPTARFLVAGLALALAACSSPSASSVESAGAPEIEAVAISLADFMIDPSSLSVAGPAVAFDVTNAGPTPHNFSVRNAAGDILLATEDLAVDAKEALSGELAPGEYTVFCALAGHESLGMSGTLTVTGP